MMLLLVISTRRRIAKLRRPQLKVVEGFNSFDINFQSFTDTFFDEHIGFSREDCENIHDELKFPDRLMFHRGSRNQFTISAPHCFLYFLYRIFSPNARQSGDEVIWGYDYTTLSKITNEVFAWLDESHCHRLDILPEVAHKFPMFNQKIIDRILKNHEIPPPEALRACMFLDGSRYRSCRPGVRYYCVPFVM
jgi:hypothetical protein